MSDSPVELGSTIEDLEIEDRKTVTGNELPDNWPQIASIEEEQQGYGVLYDPSEDRSEPPAHSQIERLSYTLENGDRQLRYLAVQHIFGLENRDHPQFKAIKANFDAQLPQVVLYEGPQSNPESITEEDAYDHGEKAYVQYLVLEHNKNIQPDGPIVMESCDLQPQDEPEEYRKKGYSNEEIAASEILRWVYYEASGIANTPGLTAEQRAQKIQELQARYEKNPIAPINPSFFSLVPRADGQEWNAELVKAEIEKQTGRPLRVDFNYLEVPRFKQMFEDAREFRDQHVVRTIAKAGRKYNKVLAIMGSGHALRDKKALEQFYEAKPELPLAA